MTITEFAQSAGWKTFSAKIYFWARALVVMGIIFLINHWPGGDIIVTVGGVLIILIYAVSAFEPIPEEYDWTLVYPQLAGMTDPDEASPGESAHGHEKERIKKLQSEIERLKEDLNNLK